MMSSNKFRILLMEYNGNENGSIINLITDGTSKKRIIEYWKDIIIDILVNKNGNNCDLVSSLFQYIAFTKESLLVSAYIYNQIENHLIGYPLKVGKINDLYELSYFFNETMMHKICARIYSMRSKKNNEFPVADPWFFKKTKFEYYQSKSQKMFIDLLIKQKGGMTSLIVMPTGSGKSMVGLAPQMFHKRESLTIVIMPTVSLIIDQSTNYSNYFGDDKVCAYYSGSTISRNEVLNKVRNKKLSVLYLSPETVVSKEFREVLIIASQERYLMRLVVDECHLISSWGSKFRPEFQFLGILKEQLKSKNPELQTILLSATISTGDEYLLAQIFCKEEKLVEFRADALRREPIFYHTNVENEEEKNRKLLQEIKFYPKPMILYCIKPDDAERIYDLIISNNGYSRIRVFTGKTKTYDRQVVIDEWNRGDVDIMIATSAFGMGVDKSNVRTVIHYNIPSNIKDYYQEVGRGGRDGYEFLARTIINKQVDFRVVTDKHLSLEIFEDRLKSMLVKSTMDGPDELWVDSNTKRIELESEITGNQNTSWNMYILLMLMKYGHIELIDMAVGNEQNKIFKVKILNPKLVNNDGERQSTISTIVADSSKTMKQDRDLILNYFKSFKHSCLSDYLIKVFTYASGHCNDCNNCLNFSNKIENGENANVNAVRFAEVRGTTEHNFDFIDDDIGIVFIESSESSILNQLISLVPCIIYSENTDYLVEIRNSEIEGKVYLASGMDELSIELLINQIVIFNLMIDPYDSYLKIKKRWPFIKCVILMDCKTKGFLKPFLVDELRNTVNSYIFEKRMNNERNKFKT